MRLVDPEIYRGTLRIVLDGDGSFSAQDCHVLAMSAFRELILWSERHWNVTADLRSGELVALLSLYPEKKTTEDIHA